MATQEEYGYNNPDAPSTLVPEALTTYRHFALRLDDSQLFPMNVFASAIGPFGSVPDEKASCYHVKGAHPTPPPVPVPNNQDKYRTQSITGRSYSSLVTWTDGPAACPCPMCNDREAFIPPPWAAASVPKSQIFTATCARDAISSPGGMAFRYIDPSYYPPKYKHDSPVDGCSCGFYAHYDPETDFYSGSKWDPEDKFAVVRTVVEMSGKVVLGTKGVRAERMQIKAISVDWAKAWSREADYMRSVNYGSWASTPQWTLNAKAPWYYPDIRDSDISDSVRTEVNYRTEKAAYIYSAGFYGEPGEMYKTYPKPDISHLFPKEVDLDDAS